MRIAIAVLLVSSVAACTRERPATPTAPEAPAAAPAEPLAGGGPLVFPGPNTLLLSQAQFRWREQDGRRSVEPLDAKLLLLTLEDGVFVASALEDPDSRVFHKAACVETDAGRRLLTIGATDAYLKSWRVENGAWRADDLWHPSFGGKWDRLRDFEIGNVDADPELELVIATHDQGVVAVGNRAGNGWEFTEVSRAPNTFVHEIEIGDVDGDGRASIFATPSKPNKANKSQAGSIAAFTAKERSGYGRTEIARLTSTHAKEILVADLDRNGTPELYSVLEGERGRGAPVEIRRYLPGKRWKHQTIATLDKGVQARVLLPADLTGTGRLEIVVTTWKDGIWRLTAPENGAGAWNKVQVDADSTGFEHAAGVADLDGDGVLELYVSADDQDAVRQYVWTGAGFAKKTIHELDRSDLTWNITACVPTEL